MSTPHGTTVLNPDDMPAQQPRMRLRALSGGRQMRQRAAGGGLTSGPYAYGTSSLAGPQPAFPPLKKQPTTDHIDTAVLDPHEDHYALDEHPEENEIEVIDDNEDGEERQRQGRQRQTDSENVDPSDRSSGRSDEHTLADEPGTLPESGETAVPKSKQEAQSDLEKGKPQPQRPRAVTQSTGKKNLNPETRNWKDDIVTFDSSTDEKNPRNWTFRRKITITMLLGLTTACSTFASSVFSPALSFVAAEFGISQEVAILGISLFVLGYVPGPIIFAPLSETYGRKWATLGPVFVSICFAAATATAKDIQTVMITRFFAGLFASAPVTNVGGGLADMWDTRQRATAVVFYSLAVVAGPCLGPIIGAAFSQSSLGWRWTMYMTVILTSSVLVLDLLLLPETFSPVLLTKKARNLRWKTGRWSLHSRQEMTPMNLSVFMHKNLSLPLRMIFQEPMVLCIATYNSFAYGILYMLFAAVPIIYEGERGWSTLAAALPFLAVLLGSFTAAAINITYSQKFFVKRLDKYGSLAPEYRLPPMILGSILFPIGFFLLGWTSNASIQWFPSILGLYFIGSSFLLIFQAGINYLLDAYTSNAASAVAANTFMRSIFAAALPLVARPMFNNLGVPWACTLLGCIAVAMACIPLVFFKFGHKLRAMSRLAAA